MNWKRKRKWLMSIVMTFAMLSSTVGAAAAAEQTDQPNTMMDTGAETEWEQKTEAETETGEKTESESESESEPESEADEETEEDPENQIESETETETEKNDLPEDSNGESSVEPEDTNDMPFTDLTSDVHEHSWSVDWNHDKSYHWHECDGEDCPVTDNSKKDSYAKHNYDDNNVCTECGYSKPNVRITKITEGVIPTYQEAYQTMIALKETYPEGMEWTNFTPYGSKGNLGDSYTWKGGYIYGANKGVGCAAFAFILSDAAFGSLPARAIDGGSFTFDDVKVGDILRVNGNSHSVIVLQKSAGGVIVAEANYNSSVHWGRVMNESEVLNASFIITRYPEGHVPADDPDADKVAQNGTAGNLNWSLTNAGVLTISGSGAMPDYSLDNLPPWSECNISTVIIEKGVTGIGSYAFYQSGALSIYIPDGIVEIGQNAFYGSALISVTIPGTVGALGDNAFRNCANLTSVTVSDGVKTIGNNTFRGCTSLAYIDFPASITSVGAGAFMSCDEMTRVRFMPGNETVTLGDGLFAQCWKLTNVTLPQTADCISNDMFASCTLLPELYIPASVKEIGDNPFTSCHCLKYIYFGGSEAEWDSIASVYLKASLMSTGTTVIFNAEFDDPFAKDPNDPGDLLPDEGENVPPGSTPDDSTKPSEPDEGESVPPGSTPDDSTKPSEPDEGESVPPGSTPDDSTKPSEPDETQKPDQTERPSQSSHKKKTTQSDQADTVSESPNTSVAVYTALDQSTKVTLFKDCSFANFVKTCSAVIAKPTSEKMILDCSDTPWFSLSKTTLSALKNSPDMSLTIIYCYEGKQYIFTIPAGFDFDQLQDLDGWYGFMYLKMIFDGYELE